MTTTTMWTEKKMLTDAIFSKTTSDSQWSEKTSSSKQSSMSQHTKKRTQRVFKRVHWIGLELNRVRKVSIERQERFFVAPARLQGVNLARCRVSSYSDRSDSKFAVWVFIWLPRRAITFRRVSRFRFSCRYFSNNVDMLISWKTELKLFSGLPVSSFPPANVP